MKKMNKILTLTLALGLALSLVACGGNEGTPPADNSTGEPASTPAVDPYESGNIAGNLGYDGLVVAQKGEWIYYSNDASRKLYKVRADGTEEIELFDGRAYYINVVGDWVYFRTSIFADVYTPNAFCKIRTDGTDFTQVTDDLIRCLYVVGEWAYYSNESDGYTLYKIRTDGTDRTKLSNDECFPFIVDGDWVYYNDSDGLCKIRTDGTEKTVLFDEKIPRFNITSDWLYYAKSAGPSYTLYKIRTDGTEMTDLKEAAYYFNVAGDWIYYTGSDGLCKIRTDGTDKMQLCDANAGEICVAGDWIYYKIPNTQEFYRVRTDGSDLQLVDKWEAS